VRFDTPILIIAWRRPDHLNRVIDSLRKIRPQKIYVAVDGPRPGDEFLKERENIEITKKFVGEQIDWECNVNTLFRDKNLGCGLGVSSAIDWFFEFEDVGIILEDDILITESGFNFLSWALKKFRDDESVGCVNAANWDPFGKYYHYFQVLKNPVCSAYESKYPMIWGWGTWKRVWKDYKLDVGKVDYENVQKSISMMEMSKKERDYHNRSFNAVVEKKTDTWDFQFKLLFFMKNYRAITPAFSFVQNIGFDELATHTKNKRGLSIPNFDNGKVDDFCESGKRMCQIRDIRHIYYRLGIEPKTILGKLVVLICFPKKVFARKVVRRLFPWLNL
jgi:hypothetical protein